MRRRTFLPVLGASSVLPATWAQPEKRPPKGRLKQSVTKGVFRGRQMTLDEMCRELARLGIYGFDLIPPADWPTLKKYGLVPTMLPPPYGGTIPDGINRKENHERLEKSIREGIDLATAGGCPNVITLSGSRRGMSDAEGADNCVAFLNRIKAQAEDKQITICLELLNSKVNHPDYMCDHTGWGVEVMNRVNSPSVKLLYTHCKDSCSIVTQPQQQPGRHLPTSAAFPVRALSKVPGPVPLQVPWIILVTLCPIYCCPMANVWGDLTEAMLAGGPASCFRLICGTNSRARKLSSSTVFCGPRADCKLTMC